MPPNPVTQTRSPAEVSVMIADDTIHIAHDQPPTRYDGLQLQLPAVPAPPVDVGAARSMTNYERTLRFMTHRRIMRELKGTHSPRHKRRDCMWIVAFCLLEVGLATVTIREGVYLRLDLTVNVLSNLLGLLINGTAAQ